MRVYRTLTHTHTLWSPHAWSLNTLLLFNGQNCNTHQCLRSSMNEYGCSKVSFDVDWGAWIPLLLLKTERSKKTSRRKWLRLSNRNDVRSHSSHRSVPEFRVLLVNAHIAINIDSPCDVNGWCAAAVVVVVVGARISNQSHNLLLGTRKCQQR